MHVSRWKSGWVYRQRRLLSFLLLAILCGPVVLPGQTTTNGAGLIAPQELEGMFPATVYFQGKTAPVQWRNSAAIKFSAHAVFFAGLIDNSGYASGVQEKYQMYLLTEQPTHFGDKVLPAGAYGAGFVGNRFIVMDIGGNTVAEGETQLDEHLARPRPLQIMPTSASDTRLYLGRRWVTIAPATSK